MTMQFQPIKTIKKMLGTATAGTLITAVIAFLGTPEGVSVIQTAAPGIPVVILLSILRGLQNVNKTKNLYGNPMRNL